MCSREEYEVIQKEAINLKNEIIENKDKGSKSGYQFEKTYDKLAVGNKCLKDPKFLKSVTIRDIKV